MSPLSDTADPEQEELLALQVALWPSLANQPMRALIAQKHVRDDDLDFRHSDPMAVVLSFIRLEDAIFAASKQKPWQVPATFKSELNEVTEHLVEAKKKFESLSTRQKNTSQASMPDSPSPPDAHVEDSSSPLCATNAYPDRSMHPVTPSVPTPASRVVQTTVIERLLQKGREYNDNLRRLQEEEEAKVKEESPFQPKILEKSRSLASGKKCASIFEQLHEQACLRDQRLRAKEDQQVHADLSMSGEASAQKSPTSAGLRGLAHGPECEKKLERTQCSLQQSDCTSDALSCGIGAGNQNGYSNGDMHEQAVCQQPGSRRVSAAQSGSQSSRRSSEHLLLLLLWPLPDDAMLQL